MSARRTKEVIRWYWDKDTGGFRISRHVEEQRGEALRDLRGSEENSRKQVEP